MSEQVAVRANYERGGQSWVSIWTLDGDKTAAPEVHIQTPSPEVSVLLAHALYDAIRAHGCNVAEMEGLHEWV